MIRFLLTAFIFLFLSSSCFGQHNEILGDWYGRAEFNGVSLRITFHIYEENDSLKATMDSPDQGSFGLVVSEIEYADKFLSLKLNQIALTYEGKLISEEEIDGQLRQADVLNIMVKLTKTPIEAIKPNRPQMPKPPYKYETEEVSFVNEKGGHTLAGSLTIPNAMAAFPAVVLITGSGAQDRDETFAGHKPFLVIADHLSNRGIAVLRFDDRGTGQSTGQHDNADSFDFSEDVAAAIKYLKSRPDIDSTKIGLLGHSEGGSIASIVASRDPSISFIVMLAAPGTTGREVIETQTRLIVKASGLDDIYVESSVQQIKIILDALELEDSEKGKEEIRKFIQAQMITQPKDQVEARIKSVLNKYDSPWMRTFIKFDPKTYLKEVSCPVLALNGKLDLQVEYSANLRGIENALMDGGNNNATVMAMDGLNHLFQNAKTGNPNEYASIEETISPDVLKLIENWILIQVK